MKAMGPTILLTLTDNWINFNIRYITEMRQRRQVHSKLNRILLEGIEKSDKIRIATESLNIGITHLPEAKNKR